MSQRRDDDRLKEEFQALRAEARTSGGVPTFESMMERARADAEHGPLAEAKRAGSEAEHAPRLEVVRGSGGTRGATPPRAYRIGGWATAAIAAGVAALLVVGDGEDPDAEFDRLVTAYASDAAAGAWRSPTAGLLDVPGMGLTRSVPSFGGSLRPLDPGAAPSSTPEPEGRDS